MAWRGRYLMLRIILFIAYFALMLIIAVISEPPLRGRLRITPVRLYVCPMPEPFDWRQLAAATAESQQQACCVTRTGVLAWE